MKQYSNEAIEFARKLYCKYGGKNFDAIEREMQQQWPGWRQQNLRDRGKGANAKLGWISRYGFEKSLRIYTERLVESVNDDEQDLYIGIKKVRQELQRLVESGEAKKDEIYQYRDFCKLEIEARKNLDLSRDNLETFVSGYEKLLMWLGELDPAAAKMLIKHGDKLTALATAHYGKTETDFDGAGDREDEGGEQPFSLLA